jgi:hypothetical protein
MIPTTTQELTLSEMSINGPIPLDFRNFYKGDLPHNPGHNISKTSRKSTYSALFKLQLIRFILARYSNSKLFGAILSVDNMADDIGDKKYATQPIKPLRSLH